MKNKILVIFLTLVFNLSFSNFAIAVEFTFEVTDIDILKIILFIKVIIEVKL